MILYLYTKFKQFCTLIPNLNDHISSLNDHVPSDLNDLVPSLNDLVPLNLV